MGKYDAIIHMPHHRSEKRPHLSVSERAAQFSPFAALTGYGEEVEEEARQTQGRRELSEEAWEELDRRLYALKACVSDLPEITVEYFLPDSKKEGGSYVSFSGRLKRIDEHAGKLIFEDGRAVPVVDIVKIS